MEEVRVFFTALGFYTRIPIPEIVWKDKEGPEQNQRAMQRRLEGASKYLPIIGYLLAGTAWLVFFISNLVFPKEIAVLLFMVVSVLFTGAFHEDGFADLCDGFGGGWNVEEKLRIMKDSRIGTYGLLGTIFLHLLKFFSYLSLPEDILLETLFLVHVLSRLSPLLIMKVLAYVRLDETSKVKSLAKKPGTLDLIIALIFTVPLWFLTGGFFTSLHIIVLYILLIAASVISGLLFKKHLGGYTGDCLGASQQISEILLLMGIYLTWKYWL